MVAGRSQLTAVAALALLLAAPASVRAEPRGPREVFAALLRQRFEGSARVDHVNLQPDLQVQARLYRELGEPLEAGAYSFWIARSRRGQVDGYAHLGRERSQHGTFLFAVFFAADRRVTSVEIVEYTEQEGAGIRARAFLDQFRGMTAGTRPGRGQEVDAVTGATISSTALARAVRRASLLLEVVADGP